ncbi:MAG: hypothetical protein U5L72_17150 [Bacteroidales bacterium]|nr:hypothetical protein [Bacteroidales bacterium]
MLIIPFATLLAQPRERVARTPALNYDWRPGFISITELTGALGLASTETELSQYYYGITTLAGYQFTRNIKAGAGIGVHSHNEGLLMPLFLDFRLSMNSQELVPFVAGAGGIMVDFEDLQATRVFINPSVGVRYVAAPRRAVTFSTGLMVTTGVTHQRKSFINFRLGFEFKGK